MKMLLGIFFCKQSHYPLFEADIKTLNLWIVCCVSQLKATISLLQSVINLFAFLLEFSIQDNYSYEQTSASNYESKQRQPAPACSAAASGQGFVLPTKQALLESCIQVQCMCMLSFKALAVQVVGSQVRHLKKKTNPKTTTSWSHGRRWASCSESVSGEASLCWEIFLL